MEPTAPNQTKPKRRRWQFSLRSLLIFNALVTIVIGGIYMVPRYRAWELAEQLAAEPDDVRRAKTAEVLLAIGRPAFSATVNLLKNENPKVRWNAVTILGRMKDERAIPYLIEALMDDAVVKSEKVKRARWQRGADGELVTTVAGAAYYQLGQLDDGRLLYVMVLGYDDLGHRDEADPYLGIDLLFSMQEAAGETGIFSFSGDLSEGLSVNLGPEWERYYAKVPRPPPSWLPAIRKLEAKYPPKKSPLPPVKRSEQVHGDPGGGR